MLELLSSPSLAWPMFALFEGWMVNPGIFLAGLAAIAIPILIHLLNKRKFKIVDWAAMDFLLDADKKNRRRIRIENILLLLLRCLAVALLGALLARPFFPTALTAGLLDANQFERIILLDDSLSMKTRQGNESSWEIARTRLVDLVRSLADDDSDNSVTLIVTSKPDQPLLASTHLSDETIDDVVSTIEKLEPSDRAASLDVALKELEDSLTETPSNINRVLYIVTDLRERDWKASDTTAETPIKVLERVSKLVNGSYVITAGDSGDRNLIVTEVRPEGTLVAGVSSRFDVLVSNPSATEVRDVRVKFTAGDALPLENTIEKIPAGQSAAATFSFTFSSDESATGAEADLEPREVKIELAPEMDAESDSLAGDSVAYFPARVVRGIPALIVDGDPSASFGRSESFYLKRALSPLGPVPSGVAVDVITENELEAAQLDKYEVIFLCNVYRLGDKTLENLLRLERWTEAGGGLVIFPGDQIDEQFFNDNYYRDGAGLSPLRLENVRGDETENTWVSLRVEQPQHPVLSIFAGQNNPFLDNMKVFRWWASAPKKEQLGSSVSIPARFSDPDSSPAIAEKGMGRGRTMVLAMPADADWTNWTSDPSYLLTMQELVRYMSGSSGESASVRVGEPLRQKIDLAQFEIDVSVKGPANREANLQAQPPEDGAPSPGKPAEAPKSTPVPAEPVSLQKGNVAPTADSSATVWLAEYADVNTAGFYQMKLTRRDGAEQPVLFAANVDPTEGNLKAVDRDSFRRQLAGANVQLIDAEEAAGLGSVGAQSEVWWYLLWAVVAILSGEQLLGWWFGRRR
ncbi:conserved hypothetical protein [Pirellula staleyi DSM 6068]|uniref:VWFA domain-containing protein n=1 Tax=Pirellula staleyi (strain ATCC 27377 / DSM 6068 / ICPB 4128) TaxID=530564 RepID=D2R6R7_PIRSD|nr:BatA domain-containing protein [Pirellula staleyi]ADB17367.1 conserved hypothetical protein [Pirellula staleyi DSM 6068]